MAKLFCRTAQGENPGGKQRIFISCHKDLDGVRDSIAESILSRYDCAVFFVDDEAADACSAVDLPDEELLQEIAGMQLLVVLVDDQVLQDVGCAYGYEEIWRRNQAALQAERMPVLPIFLGDPRADDFNQGQTRLECYNSMECFRNIQYLEFRDQDFLLRMERFLDSVLLRGEEEDEVRASFDAGVFFSYRKKDRAYVRDAMHAIHAAPGCRYLAIWYDEYLVPGEDFEQGIAHEIDRSDAIVLLVTPQLLEQGNYVQAIEYPRWMQEKGAASALPLEAVHMGPIQKWKLGKLFPDLPALLPLEGPELGCALRKTLGASIGRPETPRKRYLMGLAYFYGIDVETDKLLGFSLIEEAAEQGLPEAMDRVCDMRHYGLGTEMDYQTELASLRGLRTFWQGSDRDDAAAKLVLCDIKLLDLLVETSQHGEDEFAEVERELEQAATELQETGAEDRTAPFALFCYYVKKMDMLALETKTGQEKDEYGCTTIKIEPFRRHDEIAPVIQRFAKLERQLAPEDLEISLTEAYHAYREAESMVSAIYDIDGTNDNEEIDGCGTVAELKERYWSKQLHIAELIASRHKTPAAMRYLFSSYYNIGMFYCQRRHDYAKAMEYGRESLKVARTIRKNPAIRQQLNFLLMGWHGMLISCLSAGQVDEAKSVVEDLIASYCPAAVNSERADMAAFVDSFADHIEDLLNHGKPEEAADFARYALSACWRMGLALRDVNFGWWYPILFNGLNKMTKDLRRVFEALGIPSADAESDFICALIAHDDAEQRKEAGDFDAAQESFREAARLMRGVVDASGDASQSIFAEIWIAEQALGRAECLYEEKRWPEARLVAFGAREKLLGQPGSDSNIAKLVRMQLSCVAADSSCMISDYQEGERLINDSVDEIRVGGINFLSPGQSLTFCKTWAQMCVTMGLCQYYLGNVGKAQDWMDRAQRMLNSPEQFGGVKFPQGARDVYERIRRRMLI